MQCDFIFVFCSLRNTTSSIGSVNLCTTVRYFLLKGMEITKTYLRLLLIDNGVTAEIGFQLNNPSFWEHMSLCLPQLN